MKSSGIWRNLRTTDFDFHAVEKHRMDDRRKIESESADLQRHPQDIGVMFFDEYGKRLPESTVTTRASRFAALFN
jgi:hypothetical protein